MKRQFVFFVTCCIILIVGTLFTTLTRHITQDAPGQDNAQELSDCAFHSSDLIGCGQNITDQSSNTSSEVIAQPPEKAPSSNSPTPSTIIANASIDDLVNCAFAHPDDPSCV